MFTIKNQSLLFFLFPFIFLQIAISDSAYSNEDQEQRGSPSIPQNAAVTQKFISDEIILKFKNETPISEKRKLLNELGSAKQFKRQQDVFLIKLKQSYSMKKILEKIKTRKNVEWVQPNYEYRFSANGIGLSRFTPTEVRVPNSKAPTPQTE